ncbi:uncharacterized protein LOC134717696 [Mytilus trossulus]|uniref:uncharacterized protein LOC134717696 n=1 Tax=Mytilus trossulus TaxID=6551 RepID=UPI003007F0E8
MVKDEKQFYIIHLSGKQNDRISDFKSGISITNINLASVKKTKAIHNSENVLIDLKRWESFEEEQLRSDEFHKSIAEIDKNKLFPNTVTFPPFDVKAKEGDDNKTKISDKLFKNETSHVNKTDNTEKKNNQHEYDESERETSDEFNQNKILYQTPFTLPTQFESAEKDKGKLNYLEKNSADHCHVTTDVDFVCKTNNNINIDGPEGEKKLDNITIVKIDIDCKTVTCKKEGTRVDIKDIADETNGQFKVKSVNSANLCLISNKGEQQITDEIKYENKEKEQMSKDISCLNVATFLIDKTDIYQNETKTSRETERNETEKVMSTEKIAMNEKADNITKKDETQNQ